MCAAKSPYCTGTGCPTTKIRSNASPVRPKPRTKFCFALLHNKACVTQNHTYVQLTLHGNASTYPTAFQPQVRVAYWSHQEHQITSVGSHTRAPPLLQHAQTPAGSKPHSLRLNLRHNFNSMYGKTEYQRLLRTCVSHVGLSQRWALHQLTWHTRSVELFESGVGT